VRGVDIGPELALEQQADLSLQFARACRCSAEARRYRTQCRHSVMLPRNHETWNLVSVVSVMPPVLSARPLRPTFAKLSGSSSPVATEQGLGHRLEAGQRPCGRAVRSALCPVRLVGASHLPRVLAQPRIPVEPEPHPREPEPPLCWPWTTLPFWHGAESTAGAGNSNCCRVAPLTVQLRRVGLQDGRTGTSSKLDCVLTSLRLHRGETWACPCRT